MSGRKLSSYLEIHRQVEPDSDLTRTTSHHGGHKSIRPDGRANHDYNLEMPVTRKFENYCTALYCIVLSKKKKLAVAAAGRPAAFKLYVMFFHFDVLCPFFLFHLRGLCI